MLHRAILGSMERFIGVLIENTAGNFPLWLAPVQVVITNITEDTKDYAEEILKHCLDRDLRAKIDIRNEKISYKIREHSNNKIPVIFVVGKKEKQNKTVSIRWLGTKDQQVQPLKSAIDHIQNTSYMP